MLQCQAVRCQHIYMTMLLQLASALLTQFSGEGRSFSCFRLGVVCAVSVRTGAALTPVLCCAGPVMHRAGSCFGAQQGSQTVATYATHTPAHCLPCVVQQRVSLHSHNSLVLCSQPAIVGETCCVQPSHLKIVELVICLRETFSAAIQWVMRAEHACLWPVQTEVRMCVQIPCALE